jgi:hypothetical protein
VKALRASRKDGCRDAGLSFRPAAFVAEIFEADDKFHSPEREVLVQIA